MKQAAQEAYDNNNDPCIKTKSIASVYTTKREVSIVRSCIFKSSRIMAQNNIFSVVFANSNLKIVFSNPSWHSYHLQMHRYKGKRIANERCKIFDKRSSIKNYNNNKMVCHIIYSRRRTKSVEATTRSWKNWFSLSLVVLILQVCDCLTKRIYLWYQSSKNKRDIFHVIRTQMEFYYKHKSNLYKKNKTYSLIEWL